MQIDNAPYIIEETSDFAVVFKPAKMHCAPKNSDHRGTKANQKEENTLLDWFTVKSPHIYDIMHRLDYETHGLVIFEKNEKSFNFFKDLQDEGKFIKEYSAVCVSAEKACREGFPPPPLEQQPMIIESYFRPYGPERKLVRPVIDIEKKHKEIAKDKGGFYRTEIISIEDNVYTVRIKRGFRHQIRCHLCWIGFPIQNDPLYGEGSAGNLALRSHALIFADPASGNRRECRVSPLAISIA
jgi:23S rRNA pseudouridine1911/1915/1917 synthase